MKTVHQSRQCPKCKKGMLDTRVERAMMIKKLFFWLPIKRYRCSFCYKRTYLLTTSDIVTPEPDHDAFSAAVFFSELPQHPEKHMRPPFSRHKPPNTKSPRIYTNRNSGDVKIRYSEEQMNRYTSTYTRI